jgi:hypothetical protein
MARLPSWRDQLQQSYVGSRKWGTGINPIHRQKQGYEGRNLAPGSYEPVNTGLVNEYYGFTDEDMAASYQDLGWMKQHPNLGDPSIRGHVDMPSWGYGPTAGPQGAGKRALRQGMNPRESHPNQVQSGSSAAGWLNKITGAVLDSVTSDDSQLYVQTSMTQRDQTRVNDRAVNRGTDDARHGIPSRIPGMKVLVYSGDYRHDEMTPKEQTFGYRPWRYRTAGTGPREWMLPNEMYVSEPLRRELPVDVDQGINDTQAGNDAIDDYVEGWY